MSVERISLPAISATSKSNDGWSRFWRVFLGRPVVAFGSAIILLAAMMALLAPWLAPYDPDAISLGDALAAPSLAHWLGTDALGRDTLSRVIYGARVSIGIGVFAVMLASVVGLALGSVAGYYGGWIYTLIMRVMDAFLSFPKILVALVIAALLGGGAFNLILALAVGLMPQYARLIAAEVMVAKQNDYVLAARSIGASDVRIMFGHLLMNCFPPIVVQITLRLGSTILTEASLSFLGIGVEPPTATWGSMIAAGRNYLLEYPLLSIAPGVAIMLVVFAFNMVGDGLRDAMDPRLRGRV